MKLVLDEGQTMGSYRVAGVQMDICFGDIDANFVTMEKRVEETVAAGAWLTVFPECTTTGYCFTSREEAEAIAEPLNGPTMKRMTALCGRFQTRIVYGFLELDGSQIYNALALVDASGLRGSYRKVHLPTLGVDRFTTTGDRGFDVVELPEMQIGMNICYDSSFPESARVLTLLGAELIVLPTNWPPTSGLTADVIPPARALENHVYFMAVNRIGTERGFRFIGKSRICDPLGATLAIADHDREAILYADIDPEFARAKHRVNIPGEHEVHRMEDRRPGSYGPVVE